MAKNANGKYVRKSECNLISGAIKEDLEEIMRKQNLIMENHLPHINEKLNRIEIATAIIALLALGAGGWKVTALLI